MNTNLKYLTLMKQKIILNAPKQTKAMNMQTF